MVRLFCISAAIFILSLRGYGEEPHSVGLEEMANTLRGDVRLVVLGDSYSAPWFFRVPAAFLRVAPIPKITAIEGGSRKYHDIIRSIPLCEPVSTIARGEPLGFTVEQQEPSKIFFALPVRSIHEIYADQNLVLGNENGLLEFRVQNYRIEQSVHGPFSEVGDHVRFRMLYRCTSNLSLQFPSLQLHEYNGTSTNMNLKKNARGFLHLGEDPLVGRTPMPSQINAALPDIELNSDIGNFLRVRASADPAHIGSNTYLESAGCIYYHTDEWGERLPGMYYSYLADDGWAYDGFFGDAGATSAFDTHFSHDQLVHWLDVTTLDSAQPVVFTWYLAPEQLDYNEAIITFEHMIDEMNSACSEVGIQNVFHLLIVSHMYYFGNGHGNGELAHDFMQAQQDAAFDLAQKRDNVAGVSIYSATDGVLFDGSNESVQWLQANGFDNFEYGTHSVDLTAGELNGDLLDNNRLHPGSDDSASFFAAILSDIVRDAGCPTDFVGNGVIDVHDILTLIASWGNSGETDVNGDGVTDVEDLLLVISSWGDCWPVQAPFDTTAN